MTYESKQKIDSLLNKNPQFSTVLNKLLNSANNPFQEGFPFVTDTSFRKRFAKNMNKQFQTSGTLCWVYHDALKKMRLGFEDVKDEDDEEEDDFWNEPLDIMELFHFLDIGKTSNPVIHDHNQQGTLTTSIANNLYYRTGTIAESGYIDSERFDRLVNSSFSFQQRYGADNKIEEKYAEIIRQSRQNRFKNNSQKYTDLFSQQQQQQQEELKNDYTNHDSQSSISRIQNAIRSKLTGQLFDMIEDNLNPYKKKRKQTKMSNNGDLTNRNKSDTNGSSQYWRRFSSSIEQSIKERSLSIRRMSVNNNRRGFGFGRNVLTTERLSNQWADQDSSEQDFGFFNHINNGLNSSSFLKKRSATIHVRSTIKDIQEEDDVKHQQSDGRNNRKQTRVFGNQQSSIGSSNNSNFMGRPKIKQATMRKPSSGIYLNNDVLY